MIRIAVITAALALQGCATAASYADCNHAEIVRSAAQATIDAIDYACRIPAEQPLNDADENG